jgi:hypothetical protein
MLAPMVLDICYIATETGEWVLIDQDSLPLVLDYRWYLIPQGKRKRVRGRLRTDYRKMEYIHHVVLGKGYIDHINRNPLDNRKVNLRFCDHTTNMRNIRASSNSGHLGVVYNPKKKHWVAQLSVGPRGKAKCYSKRCYSLEEAIEARKELERLCWPL